MPFNANTYRMNQYRDKARWELEQARDIKVRAARGDAYDWEIERIPTFVKLARISWGLYLSLRRVHDADLASKRSIRRAAR